MTEPSEEVGAPGAFSRETLNPLVFNVLVYGLFLAVLYDVYRAFDPAIAAGWRHLAAALVPVVFMLYVALKTEGTRHIDLGAASVVVALGAAAAGYFLGAWFRPSIGSVVNVVVMAFSASVLVLMQARTSGGLTYDLVYGLMLGLLADLAFGAL